MGNIRAAITGVGGYLPDYVLDNFELSRMVDTSDEWIMSRIGINTRHILKGEGVGTSYMAERAVNELFEKTNVDPDTIDLCICATVTPDMLFPNLSSLVSYKTGMKNAFAFDVSAACSGFLYALHTASQFIEAGTYKRIVVVGADKMSAIIDPEDRNTVPIFGDGAGAIMLEATTDGLGIIDALLRTDGAGGPYLYMKAGGSSYPATHETVDNKWHFAHQEGQVVFKAAVSNMSDVTQKVMERNNISKEDLTYLVPHQANMRIIDAVANRLDIPKDKCMVNIQRYGNTTAATLPLCLWDYEHLLKKGDNIVLTTFGGGFSWGALYLKWAYDGVDFTKK